MKLTKSEFKEMLKECIVELLTEGKLSAGQLAGEPHQQQGSRATFAQHQQEQQDNGYTANTRLNEAVRATAMAVAKGDPRQSKMFESVFQDTAMTTLQEKLQADKVLAGGGGYAGMPATPQQKESDEAQLNSFAAKGRWANLAFGGSNGKLPGGNQ